MRRHAAPRALHSFPTRRSSDLGAYAQRFAAPFERGGSENPYAIHAELQDTMQELVGIIRRRDELEEALARLERLRARDRKSTRLNSSHRCISYAVFCLKKKTNN